jgi:hypothetical protein
MIRDRVITELRQLMFYRVAKADLDEAHPMRIFFENIKYGLSGLPFSDEMCREILANNDETNILPKTRRWLKELRPDVSDLTKKLAWWVATLMPCKHSGEIGAPETMAASLPYLDRISIICAIFTAVFVAMEKGIQVDLDGLPLLISR